MTTKHVYNSVNDVARKISKTLGERFKLTILEGFLGKVSVRGLESDIPLGAFVIAAVTHKNAFVGRYHIRFQAWNLLVDSFDLPAEGSNEFDEWLEKQAVWASREEEEAVEERNRKARAQRLCAIAVLDDAIDALYLDFVDSKDEQAIEVVLDSMCSLRATLEERNNGENQ